MSNLPRFLTKVFEGFEISDIKEWLKKGYIEIYLNPTDSNSRKCRRCGSALVNNRGAHLIRAESLPILNYRTFVIIKRQKGHCPKCKKARSEALSFLSEESPHLTTDYAWWLARLCEIAPVSNAAYFSHQDQNTLYRLDLKRMRMFLQRYKIPQVKRISVDEVYSRKKKKKPDENRDERFFTVITDLDTRRVIWVSDGRNKESLDRFYKLLGEERCKEIEVVAMDQHDPYRSSTKEHCPNATVVWDKFHVLQSFENALNETRKDLHDKLEKNTNIKMNTAGRFRFIFLKRASDRNEDEQLHINKIVSRNKDFLRLEVIKERMLSLFYEKTAEDAYKIVEEIGAWIRECNFKLLGKWFGSFLNEWDTLKNYFKYRVTSALSEGTNNVIKVLKRRAYGFRNMEYFKLKILQVCGYLNSRFIKEPINFTVMRNQADALI